ncbi:MAG: Fe-S cluster assembly ATPase SufC, partial [Chloroflexi bacterium]|nr:Fe-S cluster assembly ATPase SufC [Chloroflexota bacterium]
WHIFEDDALMGPNGSGKSTLSYAIMGHPRYEVTEGEVLLNGENLLELEPDERARRGLFLAFQSPVAIPGVNTQNFLRLALNAIRTSGVGPQGNEGALPARDFRPLLQEKLQLLKVDAGFVNRYLNDGFSGGEKKRAEVLQMALLRPQISILDEIDSGLDVDAVRVVSEGVNSLLGPGMGVLIITHYQRILNYIKPDFAHVLVDGRIVLDGGPELALEVEERGYEKIIQEARAATTPA